MPGRKREYRSDRPIVPELAAGAVLFHRSTRKLLLLHYRDEDRWGFPKGHVDSGESLGQAALREVLEETGFRAVELGPEVAEVSYRFYSASREVNVHKTSVYFLATTDETDARPEPIFDRAMWVSWSEAVKMVPFGTDRDVLAKAEAHRTGTRDPEPPD
ncbi:MAG: NUDIX domain-containing protein [Thermoplasmata archaeon]|nr:NUDIX domain-containing protein [Thermoplasmata archaeon]